MVVDLDASLLTAHSEKECAAPTYKRGSGFIHCAFVDHGPEGTGEPVAMMLRPGNAGANTAADHITVTDQVLTQIRTRPDSVLIRTDSAGGTHEFLNYLTDRGLGYSVGFGLTQTAAQAIDRLLPQIWTPAYDADGTEREGRGWLRLTGMLDLSSWPAGMRVIVRKERPHPGAQLRFTDRDGLRLTAFATNTTTGQLAALELRHRRRARCEDRIRTARTADCVTCRCTGSTRTASGASSSNWPASCWPGPRCSPSQTARPPVGTQSTTTTTIFSRSTPNPPCPPTSPQTRHRRTTPAPAPGRDTHS